LTEHLRCLSSAQVLPEWINRNLAGNAFTANGDNPLNFVSHARGSLQGPAPRVRALRDRGAAAVEVGTILKSFADAEQCVLGERAADQLNRYWHSIREAAGERESW
jgi:hypothetical protein